jgi:predicted CopG family antitoxin
MLSVTTVLKRIAVSEENYRRLQKLGGFGDSFNIVIGRLLDEHERRRK